MERIPLVVIDRACAHAALATFFSSCGFSAAAADVTAAHLVQAEAEGRRSHGLQLAGEYAREVREGRIDPASAIALTDDRHTMLWFDGHWSPGHHALAVAIDRCAARARDSGVVVGWVRRLTHTGRLSDYVEQAAAHGCVALLTVASALDDSTALVAAPGAARRLLGSNPLAIGIPGGDGAPICYDGSTAALPFYELLRKHEAGESLSEDAVVDLVGRPTRDPAAFFDGGAIRPSGGGRGFGLSIALALLTQLGCEADDRKGFKAFMVVHRGDAPRDGLVAATVEGLTSAGVHVPGSGRAAARRESMLTIPATTRAALASWGIELG